ncbi:hypothetical protein MGLY_19240 [Neomoorella glycerini]|uniref:Uncharacterized protein n=1 Tax=Neomoorella glycerini TaxID=55779 RepID=A0A6I5ZT30_9FIRM|nr:PD-(D/E)XK nuclease family transposase [Moorella glycerini]QGP92541.1 hypothetical protein MGLY_19240 [Moorella glycerini]
MTGKAEKKKKYERLDPKNDFLFKKLFSSPGNEDLLIDWLNASGKTLSIFLVNVLVL